MKVKARDGSEAQMDESRIEEGINNKLAENAEMGRGKREKRPSWKLIQGM